MRFEKGHIPANKGGGKRIDPVVFEEHFMMYIQGQINQIGFSKGVGISQPTLHKRLNMLFEDGFIDGKFFTDGKPMIIGATGFIRGNEPTEQKIERPQKTRKVVYPVLE